MQVGLGLSLTIPRVGGVSFSPDALFANSEPGAWYDPSDLTTMFQDRAGTTPVTATGQSVGYVLDKSGRGFHMVAPSDAARGTYNVDSNGKAFIALDGADDWYSTGTITPGTDKVQVFAGVRKLSDANNGFITMMGANSAGNGTFYLSHTGAGSADYSFRSTGTSSITVSPTGYAAPITNVVTGLADIAAPSVTIRVDGVQAAQSTASQGTGNYLANVLYIGQRGDGSSARRLNGRIYQLIVRFGPNLTADQIAATEAWVNSKTGAY